MKALNISLLAVLGLGWGMAGPRQVSPVVPAPLLHETFDQGSPKELSRRLLNHSLISLEEGGGPDGSNAIRVRYEGYPRGSRRVVSHHPLPVPLGAATLVYDVRFSEDFQWTLGGKLHGLGPRQPVTGGAERFASGWSARVMFHPDGRCASYLYDQSEDEYRYGLLDRTEHPVFRKGVWHRVALQLRLNSPGQKDGFARVLVDGRVVVETRDIVFRQGDGPESGIQQLLFSTFHGGNDEKWTPLDGEGKPTAVHAWFDNFMLFPGIVEPPSTSRWLASSASIDEADSHAAS